MLQTPTSQAPLISTPIEETNANFTWTGTWTSTSNTAMSGGAAMRSKVNGNTITFSFAGSELSIYGVKGTGGGKLNVYLDGAASPTAVLDQYATATAYNQLLGTLPTSEGIHTVKVQAVVVAPATTFDLDRIDIKGRAPRIVKWYTTTASTGLSTTSYTYDAIGRRSAAGSESYAWAGQRLDAVSTASSQTNYVYDGEGQRTQKTVVAGGLSTTTDYVYDGLSLLSLCENRAGVSRTLIYLYGESPTPRGALYHEVGAQSALAFEIVSDARGDVREMRDVDGVAFARFDYDAYGNIRDEQIFGTELIDEGLAQRIVDLQPLRYAGYAWDSETSLYYCSQRYYDPTAGVFISKDPIKADGELTAYGYCGGDPIQFVDPSGFVLTGGSFGIMKQSRSPYTPAKSWVDIQRIDRGDYYYSPVYSWTGGASSAYSSNHTVIATQYGYYCSVCKSYITGDGHISDPWIMAGYGASGTPYDKDKTKAAITQNLIIGATGAGLAIGGIVGGTAATAGASQMVNNPLQNAPLSKEAMDKATDLYHSFPKIIDETFGAYATQSFPIQGDGRIRMLLELPGTINGVQGVYEWIIDNGVITHRFFNPR